MKKYPRIYSLGSINIIHHQEFDYEFHPFRTDFTGESGVGKSIITDLIQLILIGSTHYKSSTKGQDERPYNSLVIETPSKGDYGYAYLNIEIAKEEYLLIGSYIERRSKKTQAFMVQKSLDFEKDKLVPFNKPFTVEDFEKEDKWMTLQEFHNHINTNNHLGCKIYNLFKDYHQVLFVNKLLPIDVFSSNSDLEDYAKILQAFARRGIDIKTDMNLQEFLHGKSMKSKFYNQFQEAVKKMEDSIKSHRENHQEVLEIKKKNKLIKKLNDLKITKDNAFVKYNQARFCFNNYKLSQIDNVINQAVKTYFTAISNIKALRTLKNDTIDKYYTSLQNLNKEESDLKKENENLEITVAFFKIVDEAIRLMSLKTSDAVKIAYHAFKKNEIDINRYDQLQKELQLQGLEKHFNTLDHTKTFKEIVNLLQERISQNKAEVNKYKELINFNDYKNPKSMAYWVINQARGLNLQEESIIRHFFDIDTIKPKKINENSRYLPNPNEILEALKNCKKEPENNGFWIVLSGLHIFVKETKTPIFKTINIEELKKIFKSDNQNLKIQLEEKETILKINKKLYEFVLEHLTEPDTDLKIWLNRNNLQKQAKQQKEVFRRFENHNFDDEIIKYSEKDRITAKFDKTKKRLAKISVEIRKFDSLQTELNKIEIHSLPDNNPQLINLAKRYKIETNPVSKITIKEDSFLLDFITQHTKTIEHLNIEEGIKEKIKEKKELETELETLKLKYTYINNLDNFIEESEYNEKFKTYKDADESYWDEIRAILIAYELTNKQEQLKGEQSFIELAKMLFPSEIFKNVAFNETTILDEIEKYLEKIIEANAKINQNKLIAIKDILDELRTEISKEIEINKEIRKFFKEDYAEITGDNNAFLDIKLSNTISLNWITEYLQKLSKVDFGLFDYQESLNSKNEKLPSLKDKLLYAYKQFSKTPEPDISVRKLLNPYSYYTLDYKMITKSGKLNSGSTGQTYTSIALLCIAKLSLKNGNTNKVKPIPGLRFMSIDEAEGIGSNFDTLSEIAKRFDYQIISLSISPNKLKKENQYTYRLTKIKGEERANHHPSVIFS
ncbi:hypothetical protein [Tenacibaculum maritimum]|uniref:MukB N-terminal domain-containing protein n=1 Tax=Tenacibaculum maritimum NCIMB 2154 TaxID=1349785 RepID=A0A2H1E6F4_9FLAO|nr:hypothetical protein [Tenacibaculum maritimum]SFZ80259.1 conserved protein of unknown function [Tenacibaculum maritimum NCIMB 2154]